MALGILCSGAGSVKLIAAAPPRPPEALILDETDRILLDQLQHNCKQSLARLGEVVDLSPPAVAERIRKLEAKGYVKGYHAHVDARRLGLDLTAFIGVSVDQRRSGEGAFEQVLAEIPGILECHHVTGHYSLLLKVKTRNAESLERIISKLRRLDEVERTETMVVLSTHREEVTVPFGPL